MSVEEVFEYVYSEPTGYSWEDLLASLSLDDQLNTAWEDAYMQACELDSPNSFGFDQMFENIYEKLCIQRNLGDCNV